VTYALTQVERLILAEFVRRQKTSDKVLKSLGDWLASVSPQWTWTWAWQRYVIERLEELEAGTIRRLMLFVPPRHGKTELVTVRYPLWWLDRHPADNVIIATHSATFGTRLMNKIARVANIAYKELLSRVSQTDIALATGGHIYMTSTGAGIAGIGADLIVVDDPIKVAEEAESITMRDKLWTWWVEDLITRLEPDGRVVLIMARRHYDDLASRLLATEPEQWTVVSLPALAEDNDLLGRLPGEPLCPERFSIKELEDIRVLGEYAWSSLYQQRPVPRSGGVFKRDWVEAAMIAKLPKDAYSGVTLRYWDLAAGGDDYTVGVKVVMHRDVIYLIDVIRGRFDAGAIERIIVQTAMTDGRDVPIVIEEEPGASGKLLVDHYRRLLLGYSIRGDRPTSNLELRAMPLASGLAAGRVKILQAGWTPALIDELVLFPAAAHDDQVSAFAGAYNQAVNVTKPRVRVFEGV